MILVMNSSKAIELNLKRQELIALVLISLSIAVLMWYYRGNLRDASAYLTWGKSVLQNDNPYELYSSRSGSFGPVVISLLLLAVPGFLQTVLVQTLSFLSVGMVIQTFFASQSRVAKLVIYLFAIWSSPFRENLATNQISIIVIGILCVGVWIFQKYRGDWKFELLAASFLAVSLDLKPHLVLFFLFYFIVRHQAARLAVFGFSVLFLTHGSINIAQGQILELSWLDQLSNLNHLAKAGNLNDSVSFWPLALKTSLDPQLLYFVSTLLVITLFLLLLRIAKEPCAEAKGIALSFLIPSVSLYFHFYDLAILAILAVGVILQKQRNFLQIACFSFILLPLEYQSIRNLILFGLLTTFFGLYRSNVRKAIPVVVAGGITGMFFRITSNALSLNERDTQVFMVSLSTLMITALIFHALKNGSVISVSRSKKGE
ncbi:Glycosyltransferase family 87 [Candidatus Planktophila versatilis]